MTDYPRRSTRPSVRFITGYRPVVRARQGLMLGIRQPLDGPIFATLDQAIGWCADVMIDHHDREMGMSDATIERFEGMVDSWRPPSPAAVAEIRRVCESTADGSSSKAEGPHRDPSD